MATYDVTFTISNTNGDTLNFCYLDSDGALQKETFTQTSGTKTVNCLAGSFVAVGITPNSFIDAYSNETNATVLALFPNTSFYRYLAVLPTAAGAALTITVVES